MVFVQIPNQLTEEEKLLQQKYQKLKRKKKALQALKSPKVEPPPIQQQLKKISETSKQDAKEVAKKLLKSGAISAIKAPEDKSKGHLFKRSKSSRKNSGGDKPGGYQPFSSAHSHESETDFSSVSDFNTNRNRYRTLSDTFVHAGEERSKKSEERSPSKDLPSSGKTVYVNGVGITEELLKNGFSPFGNILHINVENKRSCTCGFVTFDNIEQANTAINEMNQKTVDGIKLEVSLARRQPDIQSSSATTSGSEAADYWRKLADSSSRDSKPNSRDKRSLTSYDDL